MTMRYWALLFTPTATIDAPSGLMRETDAEDDYTLAYFDKPTGAWVEDFQGLHAVVFEGDPDGEPIEEWRAEALIATWNGESSQPS